MSSHEFRVVCEVEPPAPTDLRGLRHQVRTLAPLAESYLVPDNHLGRASVSSVAVAGTVQAMGGSAIACLNSRDRNLLGFRRDLLTAATFGVGRLLLVHGDDPTEGRRCGGLTVGAMLDEARAATDRPALDGVRPFRVGVAAGHRRRMAAWKQEADFVLVQVGFSVETFLRWREDNPVDVPAYAGVLVLTGAGMARRLRAAAPDVEIPDAVVDRVARDPGAGVESACDLVLALRATGAFAGVHLVPVGRHRPLAARLAPALASLRPPQVLATGG